ncbi:solute carrier family 25 member 48 isoform X2 [Artibeus jamaicensis]|uniref:solute carrier family 25 member 48 isoform X2 n=1 Tax=Artibeus jamaicensis TaxID=9417 RepID=UPI00235A92CA|nr:solute carrier family 25 member 48 isoform X2 [Artibeus jamaicensis]
MGPDSDRGGRGAAARAMGSFQLEDFAAGWIGGAASVIVGHPLDTVKTRLQAGVGYGNTLSCIRTVYRKESVFGFFKGMSFPLASIAVYNSVVFGVFSNTQRFLSQHQSRELEAGPPHTLSSLLLASVVAGVVSVGLGTPVDLIKIRLQMQTQPFRETNLSLKPRAVALGDRPVYQGPVHCIATIVRTEGLAGLYRGASAMLLRDIPGYCLYFIPYVFMSDWITPEACSDPSPYTVWLAGGTAGAISWGTATPMDVVKSRLQADGVYLNKYKGVLDCISQSYQQDGLKVFFRGITVNAVRGFPMSAAMFLGYELSLRAIRGDYSDQRWCHLTRATFPRLQGGCGRSRSCEPQNPALPMPSTLSWRSGGRSHRAAALERPVLRHCRLQISTGIR